MKLDPKSVIPPSPSREDYQNERDKDTSWLRADEPISLFETWLSEAVVTEPNDPHAMSLATVDAAGGLIVAVLYFTRMAKVPRGSNLNCQDRRLYVFIGKAKDAKCACAGP